jgi:hypothetical protein
MRGHLRLGSQKALIVCCGAKCGTLVNWRPGGRPAGTTDFCQTQIRSRREKFVRRDLVARTDPRTAGGEHRAPYIETALPDRRVQRFRRFFVKLFLPPGTPRELSPPVFSIWLTPRLVVIRILEVFQPKDPPMKRCFPKFTPICP